MTRTITEIRRNDRDRKRRQREHNRAQGVPTAAQVNAAIAEAVSFLAASNVNIEAVKNGYYPAILVTQLLSAAHKILVVRCGYDGAACTRALLKAVAPRVEHQWPSFVPSHHHRPVSEAD